MDVLSIEACVQAVVSAYRDASKLVQRLKDKQNHGDDFILPDDLTKEFEDSLQLGGLAIQSQYDHDVRRFGETYARGDSTGREQMKDILITLQQAVISHLREVFMDDTALDLHALKETSDDCRVNATVCLGQLYQRMSSATAAVKQNSKPYLDSTDPLQLPPSLAYSSSRSTHSSFGGQPYDAQSSASYNTYSSKTATEFDLKSAPRPAPQRRISLTSAFSYSSEMDRTQIRTRGEENVPALPSPMSRQISQGQISVSRTQTSQAEEGDRTSLPSSPPPYVPSPAIQASDEKGQKFPPGSSFYEHPPKTDASQTLSPKQLRRNPGRSPSPAGNIAQPIHELDVTSPPNLPRPDSGSSLPGRDLQTQLRRASLNPNYNTLEYVESLDRKSRPPAELLASQEYQQYIQHLQMQPQYRLDPLFGHAARNGHPYQHAADLYDQSMHQPKDIENGRRRYNEGLANQPRPSGGSLLQSSFLTQHAQQQNFTHTRVNKDDEACSNSPTSPTGFPSQVKVGSSRPRPLSMRSTSSTSSKIASFALRKGLPPGIVEAIQKPAPTALEQAIQSQPRYVKPQSLTVAQDTSNVSPTWSVAQDMRNTSGEDRPRTQSGHHSLESTMRAPGSTSLQISRSELNLPSEANLAGFCKGAVRQQLGARKKGFGVEQKRGSKGVEYYMKCTKCNFEGPASVSKALPSGGRGAVKVEKTLDNRVRVGEGGIRYRWNFLAKSHVLNRGNVSDAKNSNDVYGCYFCCAEGAAKGWFDNSVSLHLATLGTFGEGTKTTAVSTPTFNGLEAFMEHLVSHRLPGRTPGLIVANEMNCIIGRTAHDSEDFDLNLPALTS